MANKQDDLAKPSSLSKQVAELYQAGKFNEAIPIAQEFLELSEETFGPNHPDTAQAINSLAQLYSSLDDYGKAEPLLQRALKINEKALGPDHADTAPSPLRSRFRHRKNCNVHTPFGLLEKFYPEAV
jgi:tetratricopeptide (TPR) repeat protein